MKQSHKELIVEAAVPVPQVVEVLEQLVAALKSGAVHVQVGSHELVLGPRDVLGLQLHARQKGKRQKLALELSWRKKRLAADERLDVAIRSAPAAAEAIELVELDAAEPSAGTAADAGAEKGEAHEGEAPASPTGDDAPAA